MASKEKEEALEHLLYQAMQQPDGEEQEPCEQLNRFANELL